VLADPTRRRILDLLLERPRPVGELVERLGLSQPGTSKHLRALRDAGLVQVRQDAQRRWYEVRPEPLTEIDAWLRPYRRLWAASLDALERHLDAMPDENSVTDDNSLPDDNSLLRDPGKAARDGAGWHVCLETLEALLDGKPAPAGARWKELYDAYTQSFGPEAAAAPLPDMA
jgi:DNA-binding transcriptional ArsR family regulator